MSKTIYITDKDALDVDRVVVSTGDLKGCKVLYSCDLIDEYEARLQADIEKRIDNEQEART